MSSENHFEKLTVCQRNNEHAFPFPQRTVAALPVLSQVVDSKSVASRPRCSSSFELNFDQNALFPVRLLIFLIDGIQKFRISNFEFAKYSYDVKLENLITRIVSKIYISFTRDDRRLEFYRTYLSKLFEKYFGAFSRVELKEKKRIHSVFTRRNEFRHL